MSRRTLVLGMVAVFLAGLLVALAPGNVAAAGTDSMWFPVEGWSTYDSCAGEWIRLVRRAALHSQGNS